MPGGLNEVVCPVVHRAGCVRFAEHRVGMGERQVGVGVGDEAAPRQCQRRRGGQHPLPHRPCLRQAPEAVKPLGQETALPAGGQPDRLGQRVQPRPRVGRQGFQRICPRRQFGHAPRQLARQTAQMATQIGGQRREGGVGSRGRQALGLVQVGDRSTRVGVSVQCGQAQQQPAAPVGCRSIRGQQRERRLVAVGGGEPGVGPPRPFARGHEPLHRAWVARLAEVVGHRVGVG